MLLIFTSTSSELQFKVIINVVMQAPFFSVFFKVKGGKENEVTCRDIGADKIFIELGQKFY